MSDVVDELTLMMTALFPDDTGLPKDDLDAVTAWWRLNLIPLLDYWRQSPPLPTGQFMRQLQKLDTPIPP